MQDADRPSPGLCGLVCVLSQRMCNTALLHNWREFRELGEILDSAPQTPPRENEDAREAGGSLADLEERLDLCSAAPFSQVYQPRGAGQPTTHRHVAV